MTRGIDSVTTPVRLALVALVTTVLALVAPAALLGPSGTTDALAVAVVTLALTALARPALSRAVLLATAGHGVPPTTYAARPTLRGRVTDTVHHPLLPRAPGLG